jgi:hypothetical protein
MSSILKASVFAAFALGSMVLLSSSSLKENSTETIHQSNSSQKIQAAILLDVSGSMDGLIEQAKAQLWNMVSVMGKARCADGSPQIEIALYEYGRSSNDQKLGYIKQISAFSTDLDQLSKKLFALTTNGGDEYCGQVMYTSLNELSWDASPRSYKVLFIAGNEDFLQGNVSWTKACELAKQKGVTVNTIYCGDRLQGIKEHWNLNTECGNGSYTHIDQSAEINDIPTPYDSALFTLNQKLNNTYLAYGANGNMALSQQAEVDQLNYSMNKSVAAKRIAVKGKKELYRNTAWDLVDAYEEDSSFVSRLDMKTLPDSLQNKTRGQVKQTIIHKQNERAQIRKDIEKLSNQRDSYIATERTKTISGTEATLGSEVEKIIKEQAKRFGMMIE